MTDHFEDPELEGQLDRAFQASRPRRGYEDELWQELRRHRPLGARLWDGFSGAVVRPGLALAAVAILLGGFVFIIGHRGAGGAASPSGARPANQSDISTASGAAAPGGAGPKAVTTGRNAFGSIPLPQAQVSTDYSGALDLRLATQLTSVASDLPVYRYSEPTDSSAGVFAKNNGASTAEAVTARSGPVVGSYSGLGVEVLVLGTDTSNLVGPTYLINPSPSQQPAPSNGLTDGQAADIVSGYLNQRTLAPAPAATPSVRNGGASGAQVFIPNRFTVPGVGSVDEVDAHGRQVGTTVSLRGDGQVFQASGPLPLSTTASNYSARASNAVQAQLKTASSTAAGAVQVSLNTARLVYIAVAEAGIGYFEPAWMLTGTFQAGGVAHQVTVVAPAVAG